MEEILTCPMCGKEIELTTQKITSHKRYVRHRKKTRQNVTLNMFCSVKCSTAYNSRASTIVRKAKYAIDWEEFARNKKGQY